LTHRSRDRVAAGSIAAVAIAAAAVLWRFPPTESSFYPRCPIHEYLHLQCPGCGGTRALAALLHGNLAEALHWNALFAVLVPILAGYAALCCYRLWQGEEFRWPTVPLRAVQAGLGLATVFTLVRNLPL
jgi:hypothetical protein